MPVCVFCQMLVYAGVMGKGEMSLDPLCLITLLVPQENQDPCAQGVSLHPAKGTLLNTMLDLLKDTHQQRDLLMTPLSMSLSVDHC